MDVSNGQLIKVDKNSNTYHWSVVNPINNYGVNINIGDYVHFEETFEGEKGDLQMDYYVLSYNLEKAKEHFKDAPKMMKAFEHWFGPYPFYEDGFKLVEVPYLGMEHQSSVTYGNQYKKGYLGRDLSGTVGDLSLTLSSFMKPVMSGLRTILPTKILRTCGYMRDLRPTPKIFLSITIMEKRLLLTMLSVLEPIFRTTSL